MKTVFIAEKPSVARQFADAMKIKGQKKDGYIEGENTIITWCVGHLVTMCYPDAYDEKLKKWRMDTLPFMPKEYKYQVIDSARKQFDTVSSLLNREDVGAIYVCTDSGREGEYIYRLVEQEAHVSGKVRKRVWIDSQTEDEIKRGIKEAKDLSEYDSLSDAAYLRAKEDYLMGINFSRALSLKYGDSIASYLGQKYSVVSVGRVMTCVLGMVVRREREIRDFVKTPFYRVLSNVSIAEMTLDKGFSCEWRALEDSKYYNSPKLYNEKGFLNEADAKELICDICEKEVEIYGLDGNCDAMGNRGITGTVVKAEKKAEKKNAPLLYNLAELQNDCSKLFKISPDETLKIVQELYEKKLTTYPRTDARVLSTAVSKEIDKNIKGLLNYDLCSVYAKDILDSGRYKGIEKSKYCNDKQITDHYAIIPTGQGLNSLNLLHPTAAKVYEIIVRRFLCIFYPPAVYEKVSLIIEVANKERFYAGFKLLKENGYFDVSKYSFIKEKEKTEEKKDSEENEDEQDIDEGSVEKLLSLKKGSSVLLKTPYIKEGETTPPKRYSSGTLILAMENAGNLIEDEDLRAQIKGSGIGTSATRAEILAKLVKNNYLKLNKKTQIITPVLLGEMIYEVVNASIPQLLNAELTASWEMGLSMVANGEISSDEYLNKLESYVGRRTQAVKAANNSWMLRDIYLKIDKENYRK